MKISEKQKYIDASGRTILITHRHKHHDVWAYVGYQIDRDGNDISTEGWWKSDGRSWGGDMMGHLLRPAETGMKINDWQGVILERLIEAYETDMALPMATGPKMFGNAWPDAVNTEEEIRELEREEERDWKTHQTRQRHQAIDAQTERKAKCSRPRISRMEEAFSWLSLIFDDENRQIILAYAEVKAKGWDWTRYIEARNRRHANKNAWVKRTVFRKITKTLEELETKLRKREIILRDCAGLHMAHAEAKQSCKSITSKICQRDEELNRPATPMSSPASITNAAEREARRRAKLEAA